MSASTAFHRAGYARVRATSNASLPATPGDLVMVHATLLGRTVRHENPGPGGDPVVGQHVLDALTKFTPSAAELEKMVRAIDNVSVRRDPLQPTLKADLLRVATTELPLSHVVATQGSILRDVICTTGADSTIDSGGCIPTVAIALTPAERQLVEDIAPNALRAEIKCLERVSNSGVLMALHVYAEKHVTLLTRELEIVSVESCLATANAALFGGWRIELREAELDCTLVESIGMEWSPAAAWIELVLRSFREFRAGTNTEKPLDQFLRVDQLRLLDAWMLAPELARAWPSGPVAPRLSTIDPSDIAQQSFDEDVDLHFERRVRSLSTVGSIPASALTLPLDANDLPYARPSEFLAEGEAFVHLDLARGGQILTAHWVDGSEAAAVEYLAISDPDAIAAHRMNAVLGQVRDNSRTLRAAMETVYLALKSSDLVRVGGLRRVYVRPSSSLMAVPVTAVLESLLPAEVVISLPLALGTASGDALDTRAPDYMDASGGWLNRRAIHIFAPPSTLPNVPREAHALSEMYSRFRISQDADAFLATDIDVVHFAGHGVGGGFTGENGLDFGNAVVTSRDILKGGTRRHTSLAVIDACSGALAEADRVPHDRSLSVADSLLVRGTRFVLAPLWAVSDAFAPVFCTVFQQAFSECADPYKSLKIAHGFVMMDFEEDHRHPFDYGSFAWTLGRYFGGDGKDLWRQPAVKAGRTDRFAFQLFERPTRRSSRSVTRQDRVINDAQRYAEYKSAFGDEFEL